MKRRVYGVLLAVLALCGLGYTALAGFGPAQGGASGSGSGGSASPGKDISALSSATDIDISADPIHTITISADMDGDAEFSVDTTALSSSTGYTAQIVVTGGSGGPHTLQFESDWTWRGPTPVSIATGEKITLTLVSSGSAATDVTAFASGGEVRHYIHLRHDESSGTDGGDLSGSTWNTRTLDTEVSDTGDHCSLASNAFTLSAGSYEVLATVPHYRVDAARVRLQNTTDGTTALIAQTATHSNGNDDIGEAVLKGRFTIAASKTFEIQSYVQNTTAADEGGPNGTGAVAGTEVYTEIVLWKVESSGGSGVSAAAQSNITLLYADHANVTDTSKTITIPGGTLNERGDFVRVEANVYRSGSATLDVSFGDASNRLSNSEVDLDAVIDTNAETYRVVIEVWYESDTGTRCVVNVYGHNEVLGNNEVQTSNVDLTGDEDLVLTTTGSNMTFRGVVATAYDAP